MSEANYNAIRRVLDDYISLKDWPKEAGLPTRGEDFVEDLMRLEDDIPELADLLDEFDNDGSVDYDGLFDRVAELVDYEPGEAL